MDQYEMIDLDVFRGDSQTKAVRLTFSGWPSWLFPVGTKSCHTRKKADELGLSVITSESDNPPNSIR